MSEVEARPSNEWLHVPLGIAFALVLDLAAPGAMSASLSLVGMVTGGSIGTVGAPLVAYGWLLTMGVAQLPVLAPVVGLALLRGRRPCALGMVLGGLLVAAANVVTALIVWPMLPMIQYRLEQWM